MQEHVFQCMRQCLNTNKKLMSKQVTVKKAAGNLIRVYGLACHCIVGKSFGSYVTHSVGAFVDFTMGKVFLLHFKTFVKLVEHR
ncbi:hypothetical protein L7F22_023497 [Adiantum nelumboides]|nr:hypothetical protein [Adiantum nelumboides]